VCGVADESHLAAIRKVNNQPLAARRVPGEPDHPQRAVLEEVGIATQLQVLEAPAGHDIGQRIPERRPAVRPPGVP
jgi:hypothetical protein